MEAIYEVHLPLDEAAQELERVLLEDCSAMERTDAYVLQGPNGTRCLVDTFEKYYNRIRGKLGLTTVLDDFEGRTRLRLLFAGGGDLFYSLIVSAQNSLIRDIGVAIRPPLTFFSPAESPTTEMEAQP